MDKTGGPAFPEWHVTPAGNGASYREIKGGMTLRDYFAGQYLAGRIASPNGSMNTGVCVDAYRYADAMLAARGEAGNG